MFGDSFTAGHCDEFLYHTPSGTLYWDDKKHVRRHWGNDLANYLECSGIENLGRGGGSNFTTLNSVLEHLTNIQPGDTVFIGLSTNERYTYCVPLAKDKMEPLNWGTRYDLQLLVEDESRLEREWVKKAFSHLDKDKISQIVDFFTEHNVSENSHIRIHNEIISSRLKDIVNLINDRLNAKAFLWNSDIWNYPKIGDPSEKDFKRDLHWGDFNIFETVYTWTNKLSHDGHWSPNGYLLAAQFFEYCVNEEIHDISVNNLTHWYQEHGKGLKQSNEYVEF